MSLQEKVTQDEVRETGRGRSNRVSKAMQRMLVFFPKRIACNYCRDLGSRMAGIFVFQERSLWLCDRVDELQMELRP